MIHVHGVDFEVKLAETQLTSPNMGETSWDRCEIVLMDDLPEQRKQQVFWHEVVHCLLDGEEDGKDINEAFVRRLGNSLWAVLNQNDLLDATWWERVLAEPIKPANLTSLDSAGKTR